MITIFNRTTIFEWCMVRCASKYRHQKDLHFKEMEQSIQNLLTMLGPIVSVIGGDLDEHLMSSRIFTSILNKISI